MIFTFVHLDLLLPPRPRMPAKQVKKVRQQKRQEKTKAKQNLILKSSELLVF